MLRVTTLYASSAIASAAYYTRYLAQAPGEEPGLWRGHQADGLGLDGRVGADDLQALLEGRDPVAGTPLGKPLVDRTLADGRVVRAVAGFDATFSAPKSLSVWWALTGDPGLLEAHQLAVATALDHLERYGATTRIRVNGHRRHPDALGLTIATFAQTTSRADDPQVHTHAVISSKVQLDDGRWMALDARYLKRHQRMLGGLYQSALRAELTHRYGVAWEPIVNGQAEIAGSPRELLAVLSKRASQVDAELEAKVDEFRAREGRDPTRWERAALTREASADTRPHKTGHGVADLRSRWVREAAERGWTADRLIAEIAAAGQDRDPGRPVTVAEVLDHLSSAGSTWTRADVLRAICDRQPPVSSMPGREWSAVLERVCDQVLERCVDLDPPGDGSSTRTSDGRSVWIGPVAPHFTSEAVLAEEEHVLAWVMDVQAEESNPSTSVDVDGLDVLQAAAAAAVAGDDRLVVVVGPAGTGKTTALRRAVDDLRACDRPVFGVASTAKAARVLGRETGMDTDTLAKLLHEWGRVDRPTPDRYQLAAGTTLIVDEAGLVGTGSLHHLVQLAERGEWRLALVGDPRQLQAVGRGGLFNELVATGRVHELARIHRFRNRWEAAASLRLRDAEPAALDDYEAHGRIVAGSFDEHLDQLATAWVGLTAAGQTVAITASTNDHVDAVNDAIQRLRLTIGHMDADRVAPIASGERAYPGDIVATRRNDRTLRTTTGETVRNRDLWAVVSTEPDGSLTVSHQGGHGTVSLPADYVAQHVRLGYAATEHGIQADTVDVGLQVVSRATTRRGLYVGATRGRERNEIHVITERADLDEARDVLEAVLAHDRADVPAVTQRRDLARQVPREEPVHDRPDLIPDWLAEYGARLGERRGQVVRSLQTGADRRSDAAAQLVEAPALAEARAAWAPYADRVADIEAVLRDELRPAMWQANHDLLHARFGQRHPAVRRAKAATGRVDEAEAHIAAIRADGREIKQRLDTLESEARRLRAASLPDSGHSLDRLDRQELNRIDRVLDALDTWTAWAVGSRIATTELANAVETLNEVARHAPVFARNPGEIDGTRWFELLEPVNRLLRQREAPHLSGKAAAVGLKARQLDIEM